MLSLSTLPQKLLLGGSFSLLFSTLAFSLDPANESLPEPAEGTVTKNGIASRTAGNVVTYNIPVTNYPSKIEVTLQGGDGGYAQSGRPSNPTNQASKGGGGILGTAEFSIHPTNAGALRPGGEIRLIPGNKGFNRQSGIYAHAASGGGGGSGLLYKGPNAADDWKPLIIAGGGGGAYASTVTGNRAENRNGGNGQPTENGQRGMGNGPAGGTNSGGGTTGTYGNNDYPLGGGGGGWSSSSSLGGDKGYPAGGAGGILSVNTEKGAHGGFGCGGGGDGGKVTFAGGAAMSGGGGGGYAGGGGGAHTYGGGGGGSFIVSTNSSTYAIEPIANTNEWTMRGVGQLQQGFVSITTFEPRSSAGVGPQILGDLSIEVDFNSSGSYTDTGITAEDYLGNALTVTEVSNNVNLAVSGDYEVQYQATDQFGQVVEATRTVTVKAGSLQPTFNANSLIAVTTTGSQTHAAAQNFQALSLGDADTPEDLDRYEIVANDNEGAFDIAPVLQIDHATNTCTVVFTPKIGTVGVANLTLVAYDNGPDPTVRRSEEKSIPIKINIAPTEAKFVTGPNPEDLSTSLDFSEDAASTTVGTVASTDLDNPEDLTYELAGTDAAKFNLVSGVLSFKSQPDFETESPNNNTGYHTYSIQIITRDYRDATNLSSTITSDLTVRLLDIDEAPHDFRTEYGLALDGSDDWKDRSGNGIPNIGYLILGLGDPSNKTPTLATTDSPGMPNLHKSDNAKVLSYTYSIRRNSSLGATVQVSSNLADWYDPHVALPELSPLSIETQTYVGPQDSDYDRVTINYLIEEDNAEFGSQPAYSELFFQMKLEND